MKRTVVAVVLAILLSCFLTSAFKIKTAKAGAIIVPDDFPTV